MMKRHDKMKLRRIFLVRKKTMLWWIGVFLAYFFKLQFSSQNVAIEIHHYSTQGRIHYFPAQFSMWAALFITFKMFLNSCYYLWQLDCWKYIARLFNNAVHIRNWAGKQCKAVRKLSSRVVPETLVIGCRENELTLSSQVNLLLNFHMA